MTKVTVPSLECGFCREERTAAALARVREIITAYQDVREPFLTSLLDKLARAIETADVSTSTNLQQSNALVDPQLGDVDPVMYDPNRPR